MKTKSSKGTPEEYVNKGREAKASGASRNSNPYTLMHEKGHLWDSGWLGSPSYLDNRPLTPSTF